MNFKSQLTKFLRSRWARWLGVIVFFLLVTWLHMGPSFTHFGSVVLDKPGDHTSGLMYNSWVSPDSPLLRRTDLTNYPYGENLRNPTSISTIIPSSLHLIFSKLTNTIFGWNLLILIGYMSNALIMFAFIRYLVKNDLIALFAGYAITYTPYHAFASWGQPAGLFGAIFILALWQLIHLWRKPTLTKSLLLGTTLGLGFYVDGYFILFGLLMLGVFWIAGISYEKILQRKQFSEVKNKFIHLSIVSGMVVLFLSLAWINFRYAAKIGSYFSSVRGETLADAQTYSAAPYMYFMPTKLSPLVGNFAQDIQNRLFNDPGKPGLISLGFSTVVLAIIGFWGIWHRKSSNKKSPELNLTFATWTALLLTVVAFWVSLRPKGSFLGFTLYSPSYLIVSVTSTWRVFGRLYVLVAIGAVTLASIGLMKLILKYKNYRLYIIILAFILMALELRSFPSTSLVGHFNYRTDVPAVYHWMKDNPRVNAVAEYPLDEIPQGKYFGEYYSFQVVAGKPLLNSLLPNSTLSGLRRSIAGVNDPQTIPVLRGLGINLVNLRPPDLNAPSAEAQQVTPPNQDLEKLFSHSKGKVRIDSFLIKPGYTAEFALIIPSLKYYQVSLEYDGTANYLVGNETELSVAKLPSSQIAPSRVEITFEMSSDSDRQATLVQNGTVVWSGSLSKANKRINAIVQPDYPIKILAQESNELLQLTISKLQAEPQ